MSRLRLLVPVLALSALALAPAPASAQTCAFSAGPTPINFASYVPTSTAPTDTTGTVAYSCSSARVRPVAIQLSAGAGSYAQRQMTLGPDRLNYNLYSDAARTAIWGSDPAAPYHWVQSAPQGNTHGATLTIYARVFPGQWVAAGVYTDAITVTLNF